MVAPDDLKEWEGDAVLSDGATVHVRPDPPRRRRPARRVHGRLSKESQYFRFFSPKPRLTDKEVERFVNVDFVDRAALVATLGDDIIGVARYDRWPGRNEAEVAFTVDDAHQGRGISTLLLEHLAAIARRARHHPIHRRGAARQPAHARRVPPGRVRGDAARSTSGVVDVAFDIVPTEQFLETVERPRAPGRRAARSPGSCTRARSP